MIAILVHYSGHVQGVGFRLTAARIARSFKVTGWVRNLPDGHVELWAEGEESEVHAFLGAMQDHWAGYLDDEQREPQPASGQFRSFDVVH